MLRKLLVLTAFSLLVPASAAGAADTTVTFSELGLAAGTVVHDQLSAGYGVRFGNPTRFGLPAPADDLNCSDPVLRGNALDGPALDISCWTGSSEFPKRRFATALELQSELRRVQFKLKNNTPSAQTAVIEYYGIGNTLLTTKASSIAAGRTINVDYDHPSGNKIVGVVIHSPRALGYNDSGGVLLDTLVMTRDAGGGSPSFTLALQQPSAEVVEGSVVDVPVSVRRYNGSTGPVTLSVGTPLPQNVLSANFLPSPMVTGSETVTLRVIGRLGSASTGSLLVSATGGAGAGTGVGATNLAQVVTSIPALYFSTAGRLPIRLVPGCGVQRFDDSFGVRGNYSGQVGYSFGLSYKTSGLASMTVGSPFNVYGNGSYPIQYALDPGPNDGSGSFVVRLVSSASDVNLPLNWVTDRLRIDALPNSAPNLPRRDGESTVRVVGNFPSGCPVTFHDAAGQEWPLAKREKTMFGLDELTLSLPATAVSGPLVALNSTGVEMARSAPVDVREFRRLYGLSQINGGDGAKSTYSWEDFVRTFGSKQTETCRVICTHNPIALHYYLTYKKFVEEGGGLCYGYAVMAARFAGFGTGQKPSDYQAGAARAWDITPVKDGTPVKRDVARWYVTQFDRGTATSYKAALQLSPQNERARLGALINEQGSALIGIHKGKAGHELTAYAVRSNGQGDGGVIVSVYDSNIPYKTAEETEQAARGWALSNSEIKIAGDGSWVYPGHDWEGDNSTLGVEQWIPPSNAQLPVDAAAAVMFSSSADGPAPAAVTAIASGGKPQLDGSGEPTHGSSVELDPVRGGVGATPRYLLKKGREYELTVKGSGKGSYDSSLLSGSTAATVRSSDTEPGQVDRVTIRPGTASLRFATGAKQAGVNYDLVARSGKDVRNVRIATTARKGASDKAELSGSTLRIAHEGAPAKMTITLGSVGAELPSNGVSPAMTIGDGQKLDIEPRSWSSLTGSVRYALRARGGRVIRRGSVKMRATTNVALSKVRARRTGKTLTVSGTVTRRGSQPVLAAVATVRKAGKTLRRKRAELSGEKVRKGKFSLPIALGSVPKGAKVTVDVVIADPADGGASAKKKLRVR